MTSQLTLDKALKKQNEYKKIFELDGIRTVQCARCSQPATPGRVRCAYHLKLDRERKMSEREKLTETREGATLHFEILSLTGKADDRRRHLEKIDGYLQTGLYPDGRVGEIFIKIGKNGTEGAVWDAMARNFSIALQFGAPLEVLCSKGVGTQYAPFGPTNIKEIPRCTSVEDLICRWLMMKYGRVEEVVDEQKPKD